MASGPVIGIDLGTTYSCAAVYDPKTKKVETIRNRDGKLTTPSFVGFTKLDYTVGQGAKNMAVYEPENSVFNVKRIIGRKFNDEVLQTNLKKWPFVVVNERNMPKIKVACRKETFCAEDISAKILTELKKCAQEQLDTKDIKDVVIAVPARFNDSQRQATIDAVKIAGLNVRSLVTEPTAAAIAYGYQLSGESKTLLVFDLGGGTFDVSIVKVTNANLEVLATDGDTHLGGVDFDQRLAEYLLDLFQKRHNKSIDFSTSKGKDVMRRLLNKSEKTKITLSIRDTAKITIDELVGDVDFSETLTRSKFECLNYDLFQYTIDAVERSLASAKLVKGDIDEVILVGGSTRIPKVQSLLKDFLGVRLLQDSISPDLAVAHGAALQGAILDKLVVNTSVTDVAPMSVGIEDHYGNLQCLIKRNTRLPAMATKMFRTSYDNQRAVTLPIFEGEHPFAKENNYMGKFCISGLPLGREGDVKFEVTFCVDKNGILTGTAVETTTNKREAITLECNRGRLSAERIAVIAKSVKADVFINPKTVRAKVAFLDLLHKTRKQLLKRSETECRDLMVQCEQKIRWVMCTTDISEDTYKRECKLIKGKFKKLKLQ